MIGTVYPLILLTLPHDQSIVLSPYWMNTGKISFMIVICVFDQDSQAVPLSIIIINNVGDNDL